MTVSVPRELVGGREGGREEPASNTDDGKEDGSSEGKQEQTSVGAGGRRGGKGDQNQRATRMMGRKMMRMEAVRTNTNRPPITNEG